MRGKFWLPRVEPSGTMVRAVGDHILAHRPSGRTNMRRWLLGIGILLGAALASARANYIRITYILGVQGETNANALAPGKIPVMPGAPGRGGAPEDGGLPGRPGRGRAPLAPSPAVRPSARTDGLLKAEVVVEYTRDDKLLLRGSNGRPVVFPRITHKWGKTGLIATNDIQISLVTENNVPLPAVTVRYKEKRRELLRNVKPEDRANQLADLGRWALGHGLLKEFTEVMGELAEASPEDPAVKAFRQVSAAMESPAKEEPAQSLWKEKLGGLRTKHSKHYTLLYGSRLGDGPETDEYLRRLEETYRGFFYWFALKGKALPVPERRLLVLLMDRPDEFRAARRVFGDPAQVGDGFYARREKVLALSAVPLGDVYETLAKSTSDLWASGWSRERLLQGHGHPGAQPQEIVKNQILALLLKALQDEAARATVSHEGPRQLAAATGLLPPNVEAPRWVQFGLGSYFETPRGAYWPGIGAPSWVYLVNFKSWEEAKSEAEKTAALTAKAPGAAPKAPGVGPRLPAAPAKPDANAKATALDAPEDALRSVVTDAYFREAGRATDPDKSPALLKARTMAWALFYFLAERKQDELFRYFDELANLPRDLEFDDETLLACFGRAFDLVDPANPTQVVSAKLSRLANDWYQFLHYTNLESAEASMDVFKAIQERARRQSKTGALSPKPGAKK